MQAGHLHLGVIPDLKLKTLLKKHAVPPPIGSKTTLGLIVDLLRPQPHLAGQDGHSTERVMNRKQIEMFFFVSGNKN